jgi:CO/xanthine dehydrogenase Mo-binding subunit
MIEFRPDRRKFLKQSAGITGAGLLIGINWSCSSEDPGSLNSKQFTPNAWLNINDQGAITVIINESEMGQGPYTSLPMLVAEELNADWRDIRIERASLDSVYGYQLTGGSTSIRKAWETLRQAGAIAKEMLRQAAAGIWQVPVSECTANLSRIEHKPTERSLTYADLAPHAARLDLPENVKLKVPGEFEIISKSIPRLDTPDKINGKAQYGVDIKLPGMQYATITHCPVFGGKPKNINTSKALQADGVLDVFKIDEGVVVVAKDTWSAFKGKANLEIEWDFGEKTSLSSDSIIETLRGLSPDDSTQAAKHGQPEDLLQSEFVANEYILPFQAHATMEPMNCTASFEGKKLRIWAPTQSPSEALDVARSVSQNKIKRTVDKVKRKLFGLEDDSIEINTTLLGGGFGRRLEQDFVAEAVKIAQHTDKPIQLLWTREEDTQHDFYHPLTLHEMRGALDENGLPSAWQHTIKGPNAKPWGAVTLPYEIPNFKVDLINIGKILPVGAWRSVHHAYNTYAIEHFFDELSRAGNHDPLELRLQLMTSQPRLAKTLAIAAEKTNWDYKSGLYGAASHMGFGSFASEIVQLEENNKGLKVAKVTCVIDCGIAVNPDQIKAQIEGSIIFGLTAAIKSSIHIRDGRTVERNFYDYPILSMSETPAIEVIIVESVEDPGGVGEPGVPPLAPALANALLAARGTPIRTLPIKKVLS